MNAREKAYDAVDATVFSSDMLHNPDERVIFVGYLARWNTALAESQEPSPAPVQPDTFNSLESGGIEKLAHRIAWRYKKSSDPAHSDTWTFNSATLAQFARAVSESVRPQAEPVAEIIECSKMGQQTVREIDGRWRFLDYGTKLYAGAAPVAQGDKLDAARAEIEAAVLAERERCAALCESIAAERGIGSYEHSDDYAVGAVNALNRAAIEIREGVKP